MIKHDNMDASSSQTFKKPCPILSSKLLIAPAGLEMTVYTALRLALGRTSLASYK